MRNLCCLEAERISRHDSHMIQFLRACCFAVLALPLCSFGESDVEALKRAEAALLAATPRPLADQLRPIFHVTAPAQWVNDPNGPIFHKGFYHLFYQLTPDSDESGIKYWGHARSRDLAKWETLPIALAPSNDKGEESIWSGCCTTVAAGRRHKDCDCDFGARVTNMIPT